MISLTKDFFKATMSDFIEKAQQGLDFTSEKAAGLIIQAKAIGAEILGGVSEPVRNELDRLYAGQEPALQPIPIRNDR